MAEKRIIIIAGPNGAGKTTFAREYLPVEVHIMAFINADLIAAGLRNFETLYRPLVDEWQTIDNAGQMSMLLSEGGQP